MFRFFNGKKPICPIPEETRIWMENALIWLINQFGEEVILSLKQLEPTEHDFPLKFDGTEHSAYLCLNIIANQMRIAPESIILSLYDNRIIELNNELGQSIFTQQYEDENYSAGLYGGIDADGKYLIYIEKEQLKFPEKFIATLAHELSHIKILGEKRLSINDEYLTDLVTVFWGLGIFTANSSFNFYSQQDKWGFSKQGYLTQQEWGYALALFAYIRENKETPNWDKYLSRNIHSDFKKSCQYINDNRDKVLV